MAHSPVSGELTDGEVNQSRLKLKQAMYMATTILFRWLADLAEEETELALAEGVAGGYCSPPREASLSMGHSTPSVPKEDGRTLHMSIIPKAEAEREVAAVSE
jgi:hypothetical protein